MIRVVVCDDVPELRSLLRATLEDERTRLHGLGDPLSGRSTLTGIERLAQ